MITAAASWKDAPPPRLRLLFTAVKYTEGVRTSYRFCQRESIGIPERPSISAMDPTNSDLEWAGTLSTLLWEGGRTKSVAELEGRLAVAFVDNAAWRALAGEIIAGLGDAITDQLDPIQPTTLAFVKEGLRSRGLPVAAAKAIVHYSRFGDGIIGDFTQVPIYE